MTYLRGGKYYRFRNLMSQNFHGWLRKWWKKLHTSNVWGSTVYTFPFLPFMVVLNFVCLILMVLFWQWQLQKFHAPERSESMTFSIQCHTFSFNTCIVGIHTCTYTPVQCTCTCKYFVHVQTLPWKPYVLKHYAAVVLAF